MEVGSLKPNSGQLFTMAPFVIEIVYVRFQVSHKKIKNEWWALHLQYFQAKALLK
jgi:hypothetical protein